MDPTDQFRKFMYAEDLFAKAKVDIEKITQGEHGWAIARLLRTDTLHQKEDVASVGDEWVRVFNKIEDPVK